MSERQLSGSRQKGLNGREEGHANRPLSDAPTATLVSSSHREIRPRTSGMGRLTTGKSWRFVTAVFPYDKMRSAPLKWSNEV